jgi:O-antigen ligase
MMADKPLLGHGWNASETLYEAFYKPARLDTGAAIQMNDYLMIGSILGLPALAAFVGLIISLTRRAGEQEVTEGAEIFRIALAGAAVVLAIAFWFDGGLFKLSIAAVFWVCLRPCSPRA